MSKLSVAGGARLEGEVKIGGSKNAALAILAGSLLGEGETVLTNVPPIGDVYTMIEMMRSLGAKVKVEQDRIIVDATELTCGEAPYELVKKMRASFCVLGPLLARIGCARVAMPGGCDIGARPIDFHIKGFQALGTKVRTEHGFVQAEASKLVGADVYLDFPSYGATQHLMTTACMAEGITTIQNAASEPEIVNLADYLRAMGAKIRGDGTSAIHIEGVRELHGVECRVISDRVEAGTFAVASAITRGDVVIRDVVSAHLEPFTLKLRETGAKVEVNGDWVRVSANGRPRSTDVVTMPHPGFPTDLQQPLVALLCLADGTSVVTENVYERRFRYVSELIRMGADIKQEGRTAIIKGVGKLTGAEVTATDLRAGAALICAGLAAEGLTEIFGLEHIDRGYENIELKFEQLGAYVRRTDDARKGIALCSA